MKSDTRKVTWWYRNGVTQVGAGVGLVFALS